MIKTILVEDEQPALTRLKDMLSGYKDVRIIDVCRSGQDAVNSINAHEPDLVFLDIQLPDFSGMDVLKLIHHTPQIVFSTAFHEYAHQAFELNAIDYLVKPFSKERLDSAMDRVRNTLSQGVNNVQLISDLIANWQEKSNYLKRLPSKIGDRIYIMTDDEIMYIESENKMVHAVTESSKFLINYTMDELQNRLDPEKFFRIHRSTIVNLNYVALIETWFAGGYRLTIKNKEKTELLISRSAGKKLRQKLGW
jgi:two-component system LytT family response regulator